MVPKWPAFKASSYVHISAGYIRTLDIKYANMCQLLFKPIYVHGIATIVYLYFLTTLI